MTPKIELKGIKKSYDGNPPVIENLSMKIMPESFTVLLGPSGCGKSTTLRMIAGLEQETGGTIFIDGKDMKHVEPGERNIAMVFQNYALYPTMTIRENIEFGLKNMKVEKNERFERIKQVSEILGLSEYLSRKPAKLSGGQRQRVALARAMVKKPAVFLMDEPLSNLDAKLRNQIRGELIELHKRLKTTFVFVTHDQTEAMSMATDIILLNEGKIMQEGSPIEIYHNPQNIFTAKFIGNPPMNILKLSDFSSEALIVPEKTAYIGFRPENVVIAESLPENREGITFKGEIVTHEMLGSEILYRIQLENESINAKIYSSKMTDYSQISVMVPHEKLYYFDTHENRIFS
ncbi:ABC transporter ATP-binding protein [Fusibacter bizertensis]|uniref:ABC transporter ATP-binding protein n=1 Tax=Fusibacter bizertensis TaxID=1488331 RepID=A0ABT6NG64_9FIRM|nr:ABC transporter ATP-binding protein [Fusibacter bizertensis]MDH8679348.1 ABC transporter ATP-binding protein [Fusibacter bizertensis]